MMPKNFSNMTNTLKQLNRQKQKNNPSNIAHRKSNHHQIHIHGTILSHILAPPQMCQGP